MDYIVICITCADKKEAYNIANTLLKEKLVACGNIVTGISSIYWWKNRIERSKEVLLTAKTIKTRFSKIVKRVKELHSYDVPEIIALPVICGSKDYLNWIDDSVKMPR